METNTVSNSTEEYITSNSLLSAIERTPQTGDELLTSDGGKPIAKLIDFWKWYASDIVSNTMRGYFAEFIISTVLNVDLSNNVRHEWGAFDIISPEGIQVEVKSASYIQSWNQKDFSPIKFSIKQARAWDSTANYESRENVPSRHADVYVFCLLHHKDQATLNPLDLDQWTFFVLSTSEINQFHGQKSISLNPLKKLWKEYRIIGYVKSFFRKQLYTTSIIAPIK
jgi:hypothetical protein